MIGNYYQIELLYGIIRYNMQYVFRLCILLMHIFIICCYVFFSLGLLCTCTLRVREQERKKTRSALSIGSCDNIVRDIRPCILKLISVFF